MKNPEVKIPLPSALQKAASTMRRFGVGDQADELELAMNRAAEAAVPQARPLLVNAVKSMSVEDAKGILTGGSDSATQYFRSKTQDALAVKFKPIIAQEELAIRKDPLGQSSKLLQKVFGMIGK